MFSFHNIAKTLFGGAGARKNSPILPSFDIVDGDNTYYAFIDTRAGFDFLSNLIKRARDQKDPLKTEIHNIVYGEKGLQQNERRIDFLTAHQKNLLFKLINNYNIHICKYKAYVQLTTPQDKTRYEHILFKTGYGAKFLKLFGLAYGNLHDKFISAKKQIEALEPRDQILFLKAFNQFFRTGCRSVIITGASPAIAKQLENAKKKTYTVKTRAVAGAGGRLPLRPAKAPKNKKTSQQLSRGAARLDEFAKRDQERFDKQAIQIGIRHLVGSDAVVIKETEDKIFVKDKKSKKIFSLDKAQVINVGNVNKGLLESAADGLLAGTEDMAKGVSLVRDMVLEKTPLAAKVTEAWNKADSEYRKKHGGDAVCEDADMAQAWIKSAFRNGKSAPYADTKNYGEKADVLPVLPVFGIFAPEVNALPSDIKAGAVDGAVKLVAGSVDCVTNPPQMAHSLLVLLTPDGRSAFLDNLSKTFTSGDVTKITSETVVLTFVALGAVKGGGEILNPSVKSLKLKIAKNKVTAVVNERAYTDPVVVGKVLKDIDDYKLEPSKVSLERLNKDIAMQNRRVGLIGRPHKTKSAPSGWRVVPERSKPSKFENMLNWFRGLKPAPVKAPAVSNTVLEMMSYPPNKRFSAEQNNLFTKELSSEKPAPMPSAPAKQAKIITIYASRVPKDTVEILVKLMENKGNKKITGASFDISDNAVNKHIKKALRSPEEYAKKLSEKTGKVITVERLKIICSGHDYSDIMRILIQTKTWRAASKELKEMGIKKTCDNLRYHARNILKLSEKELGWYAKELTREFGREITVKDIEKACSPKLTRYKKTAARTLNNFRTQNDGEVLCAIIDSNGDAAKTIEILGAPDDWDIGARVKLIQSRMDRYGSQGLIDTVNSLRVSRGRSMLNPEYINTIITEFLSELENPASSQMLPHHAAPMPSAPMPSAPSPTEPSPRHVEAPPAQPDITPAARPAEKRVSDGAEKAPYPTRSDSYGAFIQGIMPGKTLEQVHLTVVEALFEMAGNKDAVGKKLGISECDVEIVAKYAGNKVHDEQLMQFVETLNQRLAAKLVRQLNPEETITSEKIKLICGGQKYSAPMPSALPIRSDTSPAPGPAETRTIPPPAKKPAEAVTRLIVSTPSQVLPYRAAPMPSAPPRALMSYTQQNHLKTLNAFFNAGGELGLAGSQSSISEGTLLRQLGQVNRLRMEDSLAITEYLNELNKSRLPGRKIKPGDIETLCERYKDDYPAIETISKPPSEPAKPQEEAQPPAAPSPEAKADESPNPPAPSTGELNKPSRLAVSAPLPRTAPPVYIRIAIRLYKNKGNIEKTALSLQLSQSKIQEFISWARNLLEQSSETRWKQNFEFKNRLQIFADELGLQAAAKGNALQISCEDILYNCIRSVTETITKAGEVETIGINDFLKKTSDMKSVIKEIKKAVSVEPLDAILDNPNITQDIRSAAQNRLKQLSRPQKR